MSPSVRLASFRHLTVSGVVFLGSAFALGCGSSSKPPEGQYQPPDTFDARPDVQQIVPDGGADVPPPPPMTAPGAFRIVSGPVHPIQNGPPCTSEAGSTTDTWCAVVAPSRLMGASNGLYIVNVSAAAARIGIDCATPGDPNCLMLTAGFAEDASHPAGFQGNTLVYYDSTGGSYGWRPGMLNGRRLVVTGIAGGNVHDCVAARVGNAVACLQDVASPVDASWTAVYSDLMVGTVDDASPPLTRVDTVISDDIIDDQQRFQFSIVGPSGERIAWSSRAVAGGPEILNQQVIGDATTRQVVATDVSKWSVSADAAHWGWLSAFNYSKQMPSGTLQIANFPDGSAPSTLMPATATYTFTVGSGLGILTVAKDLLGLPDPVNAPAATVKLDSNVIFILSQSKQGHLTYGKNYDFVFGLIDLYVKMFDGTSLTCTLDRLEEVPFSAGLAPRFLPGSTAILWSRVNNLDTADNRLMASGRFTELNTCTTSSVDPDVVTMNAQGNGTIVYSNAYDGSSGTLLTRGVVGGTKLAPGAPTVIQTRMDTSLSLYPFLNAIAYTVNVGDPGADGLYLYPVAPSP